MTDLAIVDDSDLGRLSYTGTWETAGKAPAEWNGTTHASRTNGSQVTFQFNGTQVEVYGTIGQISDSGSPVSTYALDSSAALTYIAANVSATTYHNRFYQSPILPDGLHTLVITITSKGSLYWLDYFLYTPSSNDLTAAPMSILSSTSLAESLSTTSFVRSTASSTSSSCDHPPNSQSSSFSVGAVAGALVGGLILLALLDVGLLYYWKKRFARARSDKREDYGSPELRQLASLSTDTYIRHPVPTFKAYSTTLYPTTLMPEKYSQSAVSGASTDSKGTPSSSRPSSLSDDLPLAHTRAMSTGSSKTEWIVR